MSSEDTSIWCKEAKSQLFVVPTDDYGHVDSKWYLEVNIRRPVCWLFPPWDSVGTVKATGFSAPPRRVAPEKGAGFQRQLVQVSDTCLDTIEVMERNLSQFRRSVSAGQSPDERCSSWYDGAEFESPSSKSMLQNLNSGEVLRQAAGRFDRPHDPASQAAARPGPLEKAMRKEIRDERRVSGDLDAAEPALRHKVIDSLCEERHVKEFQGLCLVLTLEG